MNIKEIAFTSYGFGKLYVTQQERLKQSILKIYPDANIRFWTSQDGTTLNNLDEMPPGSKTFSESMYGFKVHCIKNCLNEGFQKIIFLDVAVCLEGEIDHVLKAANEVGFLAPIDRSALDGKVSYAALNYCGRSTESIKDLTIISGSLYVLDFTNPITEKVFGMWYDMEAKGLFGSEKLAAHGKLQGHRSDEACLSLCLDHFGLKPVGFDVAGYHNVNAEPDPEGRPFVFFKLHSKGVAEIAEHLVDVSRLPPRAKVLDGGCLSYTFTNAMRDMGFDVYPVDIAELEGEYYRIALSDKDGARGVLYDRDPQATKTIDGDEVPAMTIESFGKMVGVDHWNLVKLDIESDEEKILWNSQHPIADMLSVEFHTHCSNQTKESVDKLLDYLSTWYVIYNRDWKEAHGAGFNYWSILMFAK